MSHSVISIRGIRQTLQETIRRIQREFGITALLVTHDLHEAIAMSDRTAVLLNGRIEAFDRPGAYSSVRAPLRRRGSWAYANFISGRVDGAYLHGQSGQWRVHTPSEPHEAIYAIRPEHVQIHTSATPDSTPGTIRAATYNGEYMAYRVAMSTIEISVKVYQPDMLSVGTAVFVSLPSEHLFEVRG